MHSDQEDNNHSILKYFKRLFYLEIAMGHHVIGNVTEIEKLIGLKLLFTGLLFKKTANLEIAVCKDCCDHIITP